MVRRAQLLAVLSLVLTAIAPGCHEVLRYVNETSETSSPDGQVDDGGLDGALDGRPGDTRQRPDAARPAEVGPAVDIGPRPDAEADAPQPGCVHEVYVDGDKGADHPTACSSPASPCRGILYAAEQYRLAGVCLTVNVRGGVTYPGRLAIDPPHGGSAGAVVTYRAWPGTGTPVLDAMGLEDWTVLICCGSAAAGYVTLDGFEITGATGSGVQINGERAQQITVRNCEIHGNGAGSSKYPDIDSGVNIINGASFNVIEGNVIRDNADPGSAKVSGVEVGINTRGNQILNNRILDNEAYGVVVGEPDTVVFGNTVVGNGSLGISVTGVAFEVSYNQICGNLHGIAVGGGSGKIIHNTVVDSVSHGISLAGGAVTTVRDNISAFNGGAGLADEDGNSEPTDSHNLFYGNVAGPTLGITADQPGTNVTGADPLFADRAACELALSAASPARGKADDGGNLGAL